MAIDEREIRVMPITIHKLFPVGEIPLLRGIAIEIPNMVIEEKETSGQEYRPMITSANQLRYFSGTSIVPDGYEHVVITVDPRRLPSVWHALAEARQKATDAPKTP